jgi:cAMP phosphodiesterase
MLRDTDSHLHFAVGGIPTGSEDTNGMEIRVLGCYGGADSNYRLTSFLVNGSFAVDAGSLSNALTFEEQRQITDVYISHIHMDHIAGLPFLLDNIFGLHDEPLRIHAHGSVLKDLQAHIFNDVCWPDFTALPSRRRPTAEYVEVTPGQTLYIAGLEVIPIPVNHLVSNVGLIVTDNGKSWIYPSDTRETEEIWRRVNALPDPALMFLECSFPNRFQELADESRHLTPDGVAGELAKLDRLVPTRIYHCKPNFIKEIASELKAIDHPDLELLQQDKTYKV